MTGVTWLLPASLTSSTTYYPSVIHKWMLYVPVKPYLQKQAAWLFADSALDQRLKAPRREAILCDMAYEDPALAQGHKCEPWDFFNL